MLYSPPGSASELIAPMTSPPGAAISGLGTPSRFGPALENQQTSPPAIRSDAVLPAGERLRAHRANDEPSRGGDLRLGDAVEVWARAREPADLAPRDQIGCCTPRRGAPPSSSRQ